MHGIELRHIRYFLRVAEERHFGRAAEILGISQAPLSQQIRQLEHRLGVRLFDRTTRRVSLTPAGAVFYERTQELLSVLSQAIDEVRVAGGLASGSLRIGAMQSAIHSALPAALTEFNKAHPFTQLDLLLHTTEEQLRLLEADKIDLGLFRPPKVTAGFTIHEISKEGFVAVVPASSPLADRDALSIGDLRDEPFIGLSEIRGIGYQDHIFQKCREAGFQPKIIQRVSGTMAIITMVAANMGVGVVPSWVVHEPVNGVHYRSLPELPPSIPLVCAWRSDTGNQLVLPFYHALKRCFKCL